MLGPELVRRCHFLGHLGRPQAIALMQEAKAFVFPSTLETFGLAAAEAMLMGCPTIVSNMAPFTEFVSHGQTGLLVDPHRPDELAAAVSAVLRDREIADKLSRNGRELVANRFSLERAIRQTLEFYQSCLPGQPSGGQPSPASAGEERQASD
jgi:glycosyltransferase involved in cell wall biosynthesis